jgi:hypothetical protein
MSRPGEIPVSGSNRLVRASSGGLLLLAAACHDPPPRPQGTVAQRVFDSPGFRWSATVLPERGLRVYVQAPGHPEPAMIDSLLRAQGDVLRRLEEPPHGESHRSAEIFMVRSREDMRRVAGAPIAGFVHPGESSAFFVWAPGYRAALRHELAHLYTFERWGLPPAEQRATWLVEGIGHWATGRCQGHTADALAAGLLQRGALPTVAELVERFRDMPEEVGTIAGASLVGFIVAREGVPGLRARWRGDQPHPDSATEAAWRARLAATPPARLDVPRLMREGC